MNDREIVENLIQQIERAEKAPGRTRDRVVVEVRTPVGTGDLLRNLLDQAEKYAKGETPTIRQPDRGPAIFAPVPETQPFDPMVDPAELDGEVLPGGVSMPPGMAMPSIENEDKPRKFLESLRGDPAFEEGYARGKARIEAELSGKEPADEPRVGGGETPLQEVGGAGEQRDETGGRGSTVGGEVEQTGDRPELRDSESENKPAG